MTVFYEWDVEVVESLDHPDGDDVLDHQFCDNFKEAMAVSKQPPPEGCRHSIVLVRDDDDRRAWAYLEDGKLPEWFEDADGKPYAKVSKRFVLEVAKASQ